MLTRALVLANFSSDGLAVVLPTSYVQECPSPRLAVRSCQASTWSELHPHPCSSRDHPTYGLMQKGFPFCFSRFLYTRSSTLLVRYLSIPAISSTLFLAGGGVSARRESALPGMHSLSIAG